MAFCDSLPSLLESSESVKRCNFGLASFPEEAAATFGVDDLIFSSPPFGVFSFSLGGGCGSGVSVSSDSSSWTSLVDGLTDLSDDAFLFVWWRDTYVFLFVACSPFRLGCIRSRSTTGR